MTSMFVLGRVHASGMTCVGMDPLGPRRMAGVRMAICGYKGFPSMCGNGLLGSKQIVDI